VMDWSILIKENSDDIKSIKDLNSSEEDQS